MNPAIALRVTREEGAMLEEFGCGYSQYMMTTGCILPKFGA